MRANNSSSARDQLIDQIRESYFVFGCARWKTRVKIDKAKKFFFVVVAVSHENFLCQEKFATFCKLESSSWLSRDFCFTSEVIEVVRQWQTLSSTMTWWRKVCRSSLRRTSQAQTWNMLIISFWSMLSQFSKKPLKMKVSMSKVREIFLLFQFVSTLFVAFSFPRNDVGLLLRLFQHRSSCYLHMDFWVGVSAVEKCTEGW